MIFPYARMAPCMGQSSNTPPDVDMEAIREGIAPYPLELAVLFGSAASGSTHTFSDIDIGIVFEGDVEEPERRRLSNRIAGGVSMALERDDVDIVDLEQAPASIAYAALSSGILLIGDEAQRTDLEARYLQEKLDFAPIKREWQRSMSERLASEEYGRS